MADRAVADGDIGYLTERTEIASGGMLILGAEQNGMALLSESAPVVLQDVAFKQNPLGVFQFEVIFDDESISALATHETGLSWLPDQRLEEVVAADLNISGCGSGCATTKKYVLTGGFQEIADNLVGASRQGTDPAANCVGVSTLSLDRSAVKVGEERADHSRIRHAAELEANSSVVGRSAMYPDAIDDDLIGGAAFTADERAHNSASRRPRNFKSEEAVMVRATREDDRTILPGAGGNDSHQHIGRRTTVQSRTAGQGRDPGITRSHAGAFRGKAAIRGTGADDDPMGGIAGLRRQRV